MRAAAAGLWIMALYGDVGIVLPVRCWTDSLAAIGIRNRQGLEKLRHLECTSLLIRRRIRLKEL